MTRLDGIEGRRGTHTATWYVCRLIDSASFAFETMSVVNHKDFLCEMTISMIHP